MLTVAEFLARETRSDLNMAPQEEIR